MSATLGLPRLHLRATDSTNARARELAAAGAPHGTLVTAAEQTRGRGRQGRTWSAPAGRALLCSLVLREPPRLVPLIAAVALVEALEEPGAAIKWPNDVLAHGRKLAGILVEGRPAERWAVLGIGANVAVRTEDLPVELRATAGTLGRAPDDVEPLLSGLLRALERWLAAPTERLLEAYRAHDALVGRAVGFGDGAGVAEGIDAEGRLVVRTAAGARRALSAGEVHLGAQWGDSAPVGTPERMRAAKCGEP